MLSPLGAYSVLLTSLCSPWQAQLYRLPPKLRSSRPIACATNGNADGMSKSYPTTQRNIPVATSESAGTLLDGLESWLRQQTIESVLPRSQAKALLRDLRDDRRFWAQQRRQFNVVWLSLEASLRVETRPLSGVLGADTSKRLVDSIADADDDPALVSELRRRLLCTQHMEDFDNTCSLHNTCSQRKSFHAGTCCASLRGN